MQQLIEIYYLILQQGMNIINTQVQFGITYTINPAYYLNGQSIVFPNHLVAQNIANQRQVNLETSFKLLQEKFLALQEENQQLKNRLENMSKGPQVNSNRRIFIRRKEDELDKKFKCCFDHCKKQYASTLALNLHIKNKHRGGTKKQMDEQARRIVEAELKGDDMPSYLIQLPLGYIQNYRKEHHYTPSSTTQQCSILQ